MPPVSSSTLAAAALVHSIGLGSSVVSSDVRSRCAGRWRNLQYSSPLNCCSTALGWMWVEDKGGSGCWMELQIIFSLISSVARPPPPSKIGSDTEEQVFLGNSQNRRVCPRWMSRVCLIRGGYWLSRACTGEERLNTANCFGAHNCWGALPTHNCFETRWNFTKLLDTWKTPNCTASWFATRKTAVNQTLQYNSDMKFALNLVSSKAKL